MCIPVSLRVQRTVPCPLLTGGVNVQFADAMETAVARAAAAVSSLSAETLAKQLQERKVAAGLPLSPRVWTTLLCSIWWMLQGLGRHIFAFFLRFDRSALKYDIQLK